MGVNRQAIAIPAMSLPLKLRILATELGLDETVVVALKAAYDDSAGGPAGRRRASIPGEAALKRENFVPAMLQFCETQNLGVEIGELDEFVTPLMPADEEWLTVQQFAAIAQQVLSETGGDGAGMTAEQAEDIFAAIDIEKRGHLDANGIKKAYAQMGEPITDVEAEELLKEADHDGDGLVKLEDFK